MPDTNLMSIVKSIIAQVGNGTSDPSEGPSMANTPEKARIQISFVEFSDRKIKNVQGIISTSDIMNTVRELLSGNPGVRLVVDKDAAGPPMGKAINIDVSGDDFKKLVDESERMLSFIKSKNIEGIENLKINIQTGKPHLSISIKKTRSKKYIHIWF